MLSTKGNKNGTRKVWCFSWDTHAACKVMPSWVNPHSSSWLICSWEFSSSWPDCRWNGIECWCGLISCETLDFWRVLYSPGCQHWQPLGPASIHQDHWGNWPSKQTPLPPGKGPCIQPLSMRVLCKFASLTSNWWLHLQFWWCMCQLITPPICICIAGDLCHFSTKGEFPPPGSLEVVQHTLSGLPMGVGCGQNMWVSWWCRQCWVWYPMLATITLPLAPCKVDWPSHLFPLEFWGKWCQERCSIHEIEMG